MPGCGSAWNTPSCSICSRNVRSSESASFTRSAMRASPQSTSRTLAPSSHSITSTRDVLRSSYTYGHARCATSAGMVERDGVRVARLDPVVELLAQRGPRTRRRAPSRGTRDPTTCASRRRGRAPRAPRGRPAPTRRSRAAAPSRRPASRRAAAPGTPGRSRPRRAAASRRPGTRRRSGASSSSSSSSAMASRGRAGARGPAAAPSSAAASGEMRSVRVDSDLPELHEHPAALLEREPEAPHRRAARRRPRHSSLRPSPSDGPSPLRTAMRVISA